MATTHDDEKSVVAADGSHIDQQHALDFADENKGIDFAKGTFKTLLFSGDLFYYY